MSYYILKLLDFMLKSCQIFLLIILAYVTLVSFYPALSAGFINLDDSVMVTENPYITDLSVANIKSVFTSFYYKLYHPLVTLSYAVEYHFFKLDPYIYHVDNILLHMANVFLIFILFFKLSKSFAVSYIVSFLFAVHPVHVETVAWVSSRKDLLYSFFYLLSILFYIRSYDAEFYKTFIFCSLACFAAACLSKPAAVTLPAVLVLTDYLKDRLNVRNLWRYVPFIAVSLFFGWLAVYGHYSPEEKAASTLFAKSLDVLDAHYNIIFYLYKFILPVNLSCLYPPFYNHCSMPPYFILYAPALLYLIIFYAVLNINRNKKIFFGFIFFIVTILPSSGIMPTGVAPVADRYAYLPYLGLFYICAELLVCFYKTYLKTKIIILFILATAFASLSYLSYNRTLLWADNEKLMTSAINLFPAAADHAYLMRGALYKAQKKLEKAENDLNRSYSINKSNSYTVFHLGQLNQEKKNYDKAKKYYSYIPADSVNYAAVINNMAVMADNDGKTKKAIAILSKVVKEKKIYIPDYFYYTLAVLNFKDNNFEESLKSLDSAVKENPNNPDYYLLMMEIYIKRDNFQKFEHAAYEGLKNVGNDIKILNFLGKEYFVRRRYDLAGKIFFESEINGTKNHTAYFFLGNISALKQEYKRAVMYYTKAILSTKDNGEYYYKRAAAYLMLENYKLARRDADKSVERGFPTDRGFEEEIEKIKGKGEKNEAVFSGVPAV